MVKLSEQAQQTVDRTKARFLVVQPDGTIRRKGAWAFNVEVKARHEVAGLTGVKVYDRQTGEFLTDAPLGDTAVIKPVDASEPKITLISATATDKNGKVLADVVDIGAALAQANGDQPIGDGSRLPGDVLTAAEHSKAFPGGESIVPNDEPPVLTGDPEVDAALVAEAAEAGAPAQATPILDQMIEVLSGGKPRGKRNGRSKKDGKPTGAKVDRGVVVRRKK